MAKKKKINKTVVGVVTAIGFLLITIAGVLAVRSLKQSDPVHWVRLAEAAAADEDWTQARFYYGRAYQVSNDATYLVDMGRMEFEAGEEFRAGQFWNEAITRDPTLVVAHERLIDLRVEIADMYHQPTAWLRLKEAAEALLKVDAQNPKGLFTRGYAFMELYKLTKEKDGGSVRKGFENIRRAVQLAPEEVQYSISLATYLINPTLNPAQKADQRFEEVERILRRLVEDNQEPGEDAARVRFTLARFLGATGKPDDAVAMFAEAQAFAGSNQKTIALVKNQEAQYWSGRWYGATKDPDQADNVETYYEKARSLLEESIQLDEKAFLPYLMLAELHARRGERLEAITACERRINKPINRIGLKAGVRKYARYMLLVKAVDESLAYAVGLGTTSPEFDATVTKAEGFCKLALEEFPSRGAALHSMGKIRLARGDELDAIAFFQRAKDAYGIPNWENSKTLAQLLLRNNQPGAAMEAIKNALADPKANPLCFGVAAQIALALDDPISALRYSEKVLRAMPGNREALRIKMHALRKHGDTELADAIAQSLGESNAADVLQQAALLQSEGKTEEAIGVLTKFLHNAPTDVVVLRRAISVLNTAGRHDQARALAQQALQADPDRYEIKLLATLADPNLTDEQRSDAQLKIIEGIADPFQRSLELASWYGKLGQKTEYIQALGEAEKHLLAPDNPLSESAKRRYFRSIIERQFVYALKERSPDDVDAIVNKAVKSNIDGADGLTYRGRALMHAKQPEAALVSFKQALSKQPTDARTLSYVGQCHLSLDPPQLFEAKTYFARAVAANPNLGPAQKGLAIVAKVRGDKAEFDQRLAIAAKLMPDDPWIKDALLVQHEEAAPEAAIARREEIRANHPQNIENLLALGRLYFRAARIKDATQCYETILQAPDLDNRTLVTASAFFRQTGDTERALQVLEDLVKKTTEPESKANTILLIADHWHKLGDAAKADAALTRAAGVAETLGVCAATAKFKADVGDNAAALQWYGRAVELADQSSPELAAYFRRARIDVLFRMRDHDQAEQEIADFIERYPDDPSGLLLKSAIDTVRGDIDSAVAGIEKYLDKKPDDLNAMFQRARLYFTQGRYAVAIRDLERLRSIDPNYKNYAARILLADGYVLTNRMDLAYDGLESIVREAPTAKNVAVHLIVLYREHERYADAVRVCTSMANRYPKNPLWVKNRADIRTQIKDTQSAIDDYKRAAQLSAYGPHYTAALLKAYIDANEFDEGIDYYTQTIPAERRAPRVMAGYAELLAGKGQLNQAVTQFLTAFERGGFADFGFVQGVMQSVITACGDDPEKTIDLFRKEPDNPRLKRSAEHILAMVLAQYHRDSEALAMMKNLLETAGSDTEKIMLLATMGHAYEGQRDWQGAKTAYEDLLRIDDQHLLGLNNLAFLLSDKLDRPAEALPYARKASALYPINAVRDTLAWTHVQLGQYRAAIAILSESLKEDPRYVPAIYHLAEAYRRDNDLEKAAHLLDGAANLIEEGVGTDYRAKVRKAINDVRRGETAP